MKIIVKINIIVITSLLLSCKDIQKEKEINVHPKSIEKKGVFYDYYKKVLDSTRVMSDSENYDFISSNFLNSSKSDKLEYALYFRYLTIRKDETFDETVGMESFEMFKKYPKKGIILKQYLQTIPESERKIIINAIVSNICIELNSHSYTLEKFKKDFEFLNNSNGIYSFENCLKNWVE